MAYDEGLAHRVRELLEDHPGYDEKKMFGGLCFLLGGNMAVGVTGEDLMVRVGKQGHDEAMAQPHARPMDFTRKQMTGFVYVAPEGTAEDDALQAWVDRGAAHAESLPPKQPHHPTPAVQ